MIAWALLNWQKVLVGIAALLLCIYIGILKLELGTARGKVAELTGKVSQLETENKEWKRVYDILADKVVEQNDAIQKWQAHAKTASTKAAQAVKEAQVIQAHSQEEITRLRAQKGATCEDALKHIRETLK